MRFSSSTRASPENRDDINDAKALGAAGDTTSTARRANGRGSSTGSADTFTLAEAATAETPTALPDASHGPVFIEPAEEKVPERDRPASMQSAPLANGHALSIATEPEQKEPACGSHAMPERPVDENHNPLMSSSTFVAPERTAPSADVPGARSTPPDEAKDADLCMSGSQSARAALEGRVVMAASSLEPTDATPEIQAPHALAGYDSAAEYEEALLKYARSLDGAFYPE